MDDDWYPYDLRHRRHLIRSQRNKYRVKGWLPTLIFGSLGTLSIGIGFMEMSAGQMTELNCQRSINQTINCTRTITTGLTREAPIEIKNIEAAQIQRVGRKFRNAYRILLVNQSGESPLTEDFKSDERENEDRMDQINNFIRKSSESTLNLQVDDRAQSNLFALMFISTGALWILMAGVVQIAVNRKSILTKKF